MRGQLDENNEGVVDFLFFRQGTGLFEEKSSQNRAGNAWRLVGIAGLMETIRA
jgi:hypothetical protein